MSFEVRTRPSKAKRIFAEDSADFDLALGGLDELDELEHGLARHDDAGHALGPVRQCELGAGQPMPVGRDGAQHGVPDRHLMQIDAVQVVARFFGRDGEARLLDQPLEVAGADAEIGGSAPRRRDRGNPRAAAPAAQSASGRPGQRQPPGIGSLLELELGAVGQLAHDVVEHVGGDRRRALAG